MSPGHKEALAHLLYGLKEASGFVVITGEVGTGKTTILNAFLLKLPPRMPKVVIKNPHIKPENLYFLLGEAIGLPEEKRSRDYISAYEDRPKRWGGPSHSRRVPGLSRGNARRSGSVQPGNCNEKLVPIMLLGLQVLNDKLKSQELMQLKQRIGIKYHIPLSARQTRTKSITKHRGPGTSPPKALLTVSAMTEIFKHSKGYPRLINLLCDNVSSRPSRTM
jgi:general secretion pathway protein A